MTPCFPPAPPERRKLCVRTLAGAVRNAWRSSDAIPTISVPNSLASHPEIPAGYDLADSQDRQRHLEMITGASSNPRNTWLSPLGTAAFGVIEVGTQRLSVWETRTESLARAMDYLENR